MELDGTMDGNGIYSFKTEKVQALALGETEFVAIVDAFGSAITVRMPIVLATKVLYTLDDLKTLTYTGDNSKLPPQGTGYAIAGYYALGGVYHFEKLERLASKGREELLALRQNGKTSFRCIGRQEQFHLGRRQHPLGG